MYLVGWVAMAFLLFPSLVTAAADPPAAPDLTVLHSDAQGLVFELRVPTYNIGWQSVKGVTYQTVDVPGWAQTTRPGWPQLPMRTVMIGVPAGAEIQVQVLDRQTIMLPGHYTILPAPRYLLDSTVMPHELLDSGQLPRPHFAPDATRYAQDTFSPLPVVRVAREGILRGQRVAVLEVRPFRYRPALGQLWLDEQITVQVTFSSVERSGQTVTNPDWGGFEPVLQEALLNYDQVRDGQQLDPLAVNAPWQPPAPAYKVTVLADGIYQMDYDDLQAAGLPVDSLDPRTFQLFYKGREIAVQVIGQEDGVFDPGDAIRFYGQQERTRYTDAGVYWLTYGTATGRRMTTRDGAPSGTATAVTVFTATVHLEENNQYMSTMPGPEDMDRWYWEYILGYGSPASGDYSMTLSAVASGAYTATVRASLLGGVSDHHAEIEVNGQFVADEWWSGFSWREIEGVLDQAQLVSGGNTITVRLPLDTGGTRDYVYVDWFEMDYVRRLEATADSLLFDCGTTGTWEFQVSGFTTNTVDLFDVTDPLSVVQILSGTVDAGYELRFEDQVTGSVRYAAWAEAAYLVPDSIVLDTPSDWQSSGNGADYIIITHADFLTQSQSLADYRQDQGLRVAVVDEADIYDEFSYGIADPHAIKDFLTYAYSHWQSPAPAYVVLVGDGTYDFKDYYGLGPRNYISPFLAVVDPWLGEIPADNQYVCVDGPGDRLPDMHLGRIAVNTAAEAQAVVDKITTYEQVPSTAGWNRQLTFVADNIPDSAGDFVATSESLRNNHVEVSYTSDTVYLNDYCGPPTSPSSPCPAATADLIAAIDAGRLLVNYVGHGGTRQWAAEKILYNTDVDTMANDGKYPISVAMTCAEGYYAHHWADCLSETLLRASHKGAVATWGMTGFGTVEGHDLLNTAFFDAIFFKDTTLLGPATMAGKVNLWQAGGHDYLLDATLVFGDPALHLNTLEADLQMQLSVKTPAQIAPGDVLTYTLTFTNAGQAVAHRVVVSDIVPPQLIRPVVVYSSAEVLSRSVGITFTWAITDLLPGEGGEIRFRATVDPALSLPLTITNRAFVRSTTSDIDPADNQATVVVGSNMRFIFLPLVLKSFPYRRVEGPSLYFSIYLWDSR